MTVEKEPKTRKPRGTKRLPKPSARLTEPEKAEAIALWQAGAVTLEDLATKFNKTTQTFHVLFKNAGIIKGSASAEAAVAIKAKVEETVLGEAAVYAQRIKDTKEQHYKAIDLIGKLMSATVINAKKNNIPFANIGGDLKSLKLAAEGLKIVRDEKYVLLDLVNNDDLNDRPLPTLNVQELSIKDIEEMARANRVQDEDGEDMDLTLGDEDYIGIPDDNDRVETE